MNRSDLHKGDLGAQRARIAPLLTGEDIAELLAIADFELICGGCLTFHKVDLPTERLREMRLIDRKRPPKTDATGREFSYSANARWLTLTKLGWLTLLTRAETEMAHLLPPAYGAEDAA